jgi:hypothetical protein
VKHRHLLPEDIDQLVDGEEGFGVAPLQAHVAQCASCRDLVDAQRSVVGALERLPHFSPSPLFAYHVMREVTVFEPWYVTALDTVRRFVPRSRPARLLAGATAGLMGVVLTTMVLWIGTRLDAALFIANVASERVRLATMSTVGSLASSALGDGAFALLRGRGNAGFVIALSAFLVTVVAAAFGLRAVAATSRRRRM